MEGRERGKVGGRKEEKKKEKERKGGIREKEGSEGGRKEGGRKEEGKRGRKEGGKAGRKERETHSSIGVHSVFRSLKKNALCNHIAH